MSGNAKKKEASKGSNESPNRIILNELLAANEENHRLYFDVQKQLKQIKQQNVQIEKQKQELLIFSNEKDSTMKQIDSLNVQLQTALSKINELTTKNHDQNDQIKTLTREINNLRAIGNQLRQAAHPSDEKHFEANQQKSIKTRAKKRKVDDTEDNIYEVEKILNHKIVKNEKLFLIRWKNFDPSHDSWEVEKNLSCPSILKKYLKNARKE